MSTPDSAAPRREEEGNSPEVAPWAFGVFALVAGTLAILFTGSMRVGGFTDPHDPGPGALPRMLGMLLAAGGAVDIFRSVLQRKRGRSAFPTGDLERLQMKAGVQSGAVVLALVVLYAALLPILGFALSTLGLTLALLRWMGAPWKLSLVVAIALIATVMLLFQMVFDVVLPAGRIGIHL